MNQLNMNLSMPVAETRLERQFREFHAANPHVWKLFEKFTYDLINAGRRHHSAMSVIQRIRWDTAIGTVDFDTDFKINNNHAPYYARMFMNTYPKYKGFFRTRKGGL